MSDYDNTNSGALYPAEHMKPIGRKDWDDLKIIRQGKVDVEGSESRMVITQATSREGKTYFEVYQSVGDRVLVAEVTDRDGNTYFEFFKKVGPIFTNDRKRTDKDADMSGTITPDDGSLGEYMIWGRKRTTKSGVAMTSVSFAPKTKKESDSSYSEAYRNKEASGVPSHVNDDPTPPPSSQPSGDSFDDDEIPF